MGKFEKFDENGKKIQCRICGCFYHRLEVHLKRKHSITSKKYLEKYPLAPTMSDFAKANASRSAKRRKNNLDVSSDALKKSSTYIDSSSTKDGCAVAIGVATLQKTDSCDLNEFSRQYIPDNDTKWLPGKNEYKCMEEIAVGVEENDHIFIWGPPGSGKTTLVKQLGVLTNTPVFIFNIVDGILTEDFIGSLKLTVDAKGNSITDWEDGTFTKLWNSGFYIVFDEVSAAPANLLMRLHSILDSGNIILFENGGKIVKKHPRTRFFAIDNTNGRGDDTGLFSGTHLINEATLDRFGTVVEYSYTEPSNEKKIISCKGGVNSSDAGKMADVASKIRESFDNEECYCTLSTRKLIDWAKKAVVFKDFRRAAEIAILNKLSREDRKFVDSVIQRHFGGKVKVK